MIQTDNSASGGGHLVISGLEVVYGKSVIALRGVDLSVRQGEIVALLGPNGAGKTTTLRAVSGMLKAEGGAPVRGSISFDGAPIERRRPEELVAMGIVHVPEGRRLFAELTVEDNLRTGGCQRSRAEVAQGLEEVYARFPRLKERRHVAAGYLSGGEQQMAAIGRGLMAAPHILLLDEPSLGLGPQIVDQIFHALADLRRERALTILLVEQNAAKALSIADHGHILENGSIVLAGDRQSLLENDQIRQVYLGLSETGHRKSFRATLDAG